MDVSLLRVSRSVDVVITTHEGWDFTRRCLEHLLEQTVAHTVIVSDGASTDGTPESIRELFPHVVLLAHAEDPGYAAATNSGVAAGNGDVVVLLNNDAFCRPDFLEHVVAAFEVDERVGAVAPLTVQSDERTIDSVGLTLDVTLAPYIRLTGRPSDEAASSRPLLVLPGGGADAYRRSAWTQAGGLDEQLAFYGADIDLALRLHSLGWTTVAAPACGCSPPPLGDERAPLAACARVGRLGSRLPSSTLGRPQKSRLRPRAGHGVARVRR